LAGLKDAKVGNPAYFWTIFTQKEQRAAMIKQGWKDVGKIFILALVLNIVY
jgi:hypothetical protein